jgi:hypothetical protein
MTFTEGIGAGKIVRGPSEESANIECPFRLIRTLDGGTIERTYANGKTKKPLTVEVSELIARELKVNARIVKEVGIKANWRPS